jgi:hypothetical protein
MAQAEPAQAGKARGAVPVVVSKRVQVAQVRVATVPLAVALRHSRATVAQQQAVPQGRLREVAQVEAALDQRADVTCRRQPWRSRWLDERRSAGAGAGGAGAGGADAVAPVRGVPARVAPGRWHQCGGLALVGVSRRCRRRGPGQMVRDPVRQQVGAVQAPVAIRWQALAAPGLVAATSLVNLPVAVRGQAAEGGREAAVESRAQVAMMTP